MKLKVEGSSPLSSVLTLLLYLSTLFHRVYSLVCPALILVSPRSPCLPTQPFLEDSGIYDLRVNSV